ncbi:MAG: hypothetical protein R2939_03985 [Kofleriaceae bacterium]
MNRAPAADVALDVIRRVTVEAMGQRWAMVVAASLALLVATPPAAADLVDDQVAALAKGGSYKRRLGAVLGLASSRDARGVPALAGVLAKERDATLRRVIALSLGKLLGTVSAPRAREIGQEALRAAAANDRNAKVRTAAASALAASAGPAILIHVADATDSTRRARDALGDLTAAVRTEIGRAGYATAWPTGLPTSRELATRGGKAFVVAATVTVLSVRARGTSREIACTVGLRVAPWLGRDATGDERWVADQSAQASGSAKVVVGASARAVARGVEDCAVAVAEELAARKVVPFLRRIAGDP